MKCSSELQHKNKTTICFEYSLIICIEDLDFMNQKEKDIWVYLSRMQFLINFTFTH